MTRNLVYWFGMRLSPSTAQILYILSILGLVGTFISGISVVWYMFEAYMLWVSIDYLPGEYYTFSLVNWIVPVAVLIILILFFWYNITICRRAWRK